MQPLISISIFLPTRFCSFCRQLSQHPQPRLGVLRKDLESSWRFLVYGCRLELLALTQEGEPARNWMRYIWVIGMGSNFSPLMGPQCLRIDTMFQSGVLM